ncbi:hypothetical protein BH10ACT2_BH10ACT2_15320 [soil metagenome]
MNRTLVLASVVVCFVLPSCSDSGSSTPANTEGTTATTTATKAVADLVFAGDASLAGAGKRAHVLCNYPALDGSTVIQVLLSSANPDVSFSVEVGSSRVVVIAGSNAGTTYTSRTFEGTDVAAFDASLGLQIDTALVETSPADSNPGTIGAITSVTGTIDCGDQTAGTSTVVFSGDTPEGAVEGGLNPARVDCTITTTGTTLNLVGTVSVGETKAFFFTIIQFYKENKATAFDAHSEINLYESFGDPLSMSHQYVSMPGDPLTLTENGAHIVSDLVEDSPADGVAHTLHMEGDVTCGSTLHL